MQENKAIPPIPGLHVQGVHADVSSVMHELCTSRHLTCDIVFVSTATHEKGICAHAIHTISSKSKQGSVTTQQTDHHPATPSTNQIKPTAASTHGPSYRTGGSAATSTPASARKRSPRHLPQSPRSVACATRRKARLAFSYYTAPLVRLSNHAGLEATQ